MFFACFFYNFQYSRGKAVAASRVPLTERMIVTSLIRPTYASVMSQNATPHFHLFYFISDVQTSAHLKQNKI